jgi:hypothetical protein
MNGILSWHRGQHHDRSRGDVTPLRETRATRLLVRVLWMRRATSAFPNEILNEGLAYQLVWPD